MSSAYLVKYLNPEGCKCPPAVITLDAPYYSITPEVVQIFTKKLINDRGGCWDTITVVSIEYLGPWFNCGRNKSPNA